MYNSYSPESLVMGFDTVPLFDLTSSEFQRNWKRVRGWKQKDNRPEWFLLRDILLTLVWACRVKCSIPCSN